MQFTNVSASVFGSSANRTVMAMVREPGSVSESWIPKIKPNYRFRREHLTVVASFLEDAWTNGPTEGLALMGPTSSGKTSLIEQVCARLNVPVVSVTAHGAMQVPELISSISAVNGTTITVDGVLTMAMREGWVFVLNEDNLLSPDTSTGLNDILERGFVIIESTGEKVVAEKGFAFVVTNNSGGKSGHQAFYGGTNVQNMAYTDRLVKLYVDYMPKEDELPALEAEFPTQPRALLEGFVDVANMIRDAFKNDTGLDCTMSWRTLVRWVRFTQRYQDMEQLGHVPIHYALDLALAGDKSPEVKHSLHDMVKTVTGADMTVSPTGG